MRRNVAYLILLFTETLGRYVPESALQVNDVEEIQHAVCKVATEEVQASANATITRQLKGVCSTKAMNQRIDELQLILFTELQVLKLMLQSAGYTTPKPFVSSPIHSEVDTEQSIEDYDYTNEVGNENRTNIVKSLEFSNTTLLKNSTVRNDAQKNSYKSHPREKEIVKYNETLRATDLGDAFIYFWKIDDVNNVLKEDVYLTSSYVDFLDLFNDLTN